ncbi:MAG: DUF3048 domain-containing protein [Clostridiales Family XIII bacterium]|jgi:hypothetical protein|nr:DUF3048 domain-containing protein [Clostridiales Family XIII bacterium]
MKITEKTKTRVFALALIGVLIMTTLLGGCSKKAEETSSAPEPPKTFTFPLTGTETTDESLTQRRPLIAKIENGKSSDVRPQYGVSFADVVYETVTEGGITRLDCIYQSEIPEEVGNIRSARNLDVTLVPQYRGLLFDSGASAPTIAELRAGLGDTRIEHGAAGDALYRRVDFRKAPHDVFVSLAKAYEYAETKRQLETSFTDFKGLSFGVNNKEITTTDATDIHVLVGGQNDDWHFDSATKEYLLDEDGTPLTDAANEDKQISVSNVIVMWVAYHHGNAQNSLGSDEPGADMNAGGDVSIFRDGKRIDGTWATDGLTPPRFYDANGVEIKLAKGKSWIMCPNVGTPVEATAPVPETDADADADTAE